MGALALLSYLPAIVQTISVGADLLGKNQNNVGNGLIANLPLITASIANGVALLNELSELANRPEPPTDDELAMFAAKTEAALAESQAALR